MRQTHKKLPLFSPGKKKSFPNRNFRLPFSLPLSQLLEEIFRDFPTYNREWERHQLKLMEKELQWEAELKQLMEQSSNPLAAPNSSTPVAAPPPSACGTPLATVPESSQKNPLTKTCEESF